VNDAFAVEHQDGNSRSTSKRQFTPCSRYCTSTEDSNPGCLDALMPSRVVTRSERNFLINPKDEDFGQLALGRIHSFNYDQRIKGNPLV
jgi:hypothetical protein